MTYNKKTMTKAERKASKQKRDNRKNGRGKQWQAVA